MILFCPNVIIILAITINDLGIRVMMEQLHGTSIIIRRFFLIQDGLKVNANQNCTDYREK